MFAGKKYGGMYKHDNHNNVIAHSITTDTFTLRNAYNGTFDISGNLHVSNDAQFDANVFSYNNYVYNNIVGSNNLYVMKATELYGGLSVSGDVVIKNGILTVNDGLNVNSDVLFPKKVYLRKNNAYLVSDSSNVIDMSNTDLFNIRDTILGDLNQFLYLLTFK